MNLTLTRWKTTFDGTFGDLTDESGKLLMYTLEHAYPIEKLYIPKVPAGEYSCVRGMHRLASMTSDFETFEVMGVPGHSGILFHVGNYNRDSSGCILVGQGFTLKGVTRSKMAFAQFIELQKGVDKFNLRVQNEVTD